MMQMAGIPICREGLVDENQQENGFLKGDVSDLLNPLEHDGLTVGGSNGHYTYKD